ncbi:1,2-phenylacetyl-CoA epoxidase subunit PaaC [Streptomyces sp. NPDC002588]|uniref:1,2-phenylacetyl-CoA epoxidase subunit PaaC n=1 Tax=Streptomyces sp. NPDC002588 TaxID=3154419 RepID=UPI0033181709
MRDEDLYADHAEGDSARWAFGTGFTDPLHGVGRTVPDGVDAEELAACCVALGDDALVSAQRLAEWCTRAPELEEELALANIGLDLLGQARLLYARAGRADGTGRGEDAYAYFRDPVDFRNVRLAELPGGDFAFTVVRLLVLSVWRLAVCEALTAAADPVLAAIAAKSVKELAYHRRWAAEWTLRLGDGTAESGLRTAAAWDTVAPWLDELLTDGVARCFGADPAAVAARTRDELSAVLAEARLDGSGVPAPAVPGSGRGGDHTPHLAPLLSELQSVARAHPDASW